MKKGGILFPGESFRAQIKVKHALAQNELPNRALRVEKGGKIKLSRPEQGLSNRFADVFLVRMMPRDIMELSAEFFEVKIGEEKSASDHAFFGGKIKKTGKKEGCRKQKETQGGTILFQNHG